MSTFGIDASLEHSNTVRETAPLDEEMTFDARRTPDHVTEDAELRTAFREALGRLAPRPRQIVQMADVDGLASTEIAELLDLSPGTVWRPEMGEQQLAWRANEGVRISRVLGALHAMPLTGEAARLGADADINTVVV